MNKSNPFFGPSPSQDGDGLNEYTGQADYPQFPGDSGRDKAKAHGAYAHGAGLPPYTPGQADALGGLFAEGASDETLPTGKEKGFAALESLSDDDLFAVCQQKFCANCPVKKEADDIRLRSIAEVDNARKRMERQKQESIRYASESVLQDIIPALDNFDLALQHAPQDPASKNFVIGVEMTKKMLLDSLQKHGLTAVGRVGDQFDPNVHEAVGLDQHVEIPADHITQVLSSGYKLHDRLLRPAKVMVAGK